MNWSYNNKFSRKLKIPSLINFIPILKQSKISSINTNNLIDLKLKEIDNQTIYKIANESEQFLSRKSFGIVRDENWFKWRVLNCPYKKNILIFGYKDINIITELKTKNKLKFLNIIYISKPINESLTNIFSGFIKSNRINFISYVSKNDEYLQINFPWSRKLNFAFYAEDFSIKSLIKDTIDDIQYIDSDINFI